MSNVAFEFNIFYTSKDYLSRDSDTRYEIDAMVNPLNGMRNVSAIYKGGKYGG